MRTATERAYLFSIKPTLTSKVFIKISSNSILEKEKGGGGERDLLIESVSSHLLIQPLSVHDSQARLHLRPKAEAGIRSRRFEWVTETKSRVLTAVSQGLKYRKLELSPDPRPRT